MLTNAPIATNVSLGFGSSPIGVRVTLGTPNPVKYAEDTLGVHSVWEEARRRLDHHDQLTHNLAQCHVGLRSLRSEIAERELEITAKAHELWPNVSGTERARLLKVGLAQDDALRSLRDAERTLLSAQDSLELDKHHHEQGIRVLSARMVELGGLLQFYASVRKD